MLCASTKLLVTAVFIISYLSVIYDWKLSRNFYLTFFSFEFEKLLKKYWYTKPYTNFIINIHTNWIFRFLHFNISKFGLPSLYLTRLWTYITFLFRNTYWHNIMIGCLCFLTLKSQKLVSIFYFFKLNPRHWLGLLLGSKSSKLRKILTKIINDNYK